MAGLLRPYSPPLNGWPPWPFPPSLFQVLIINSPAIIFLFLSCGVPYSILFWVVKVIITSKVIKPIETKHCTPPPSVRPSDTKKQTVDFPNIYKQGRSSSIGAKM